MEKMVNVEKASREIGTRMLALCQQFLDEGKAIRIAGPNAPTWFQVTPEDIDGEFSVEAEGGSTQAINPAARARQGLEILNNIVPALSNLGYDPSNAVRTAITYMGLNPDHLLVRPEPTPEQAMPAEGPAAPGMPGMPGAPSGLEGVDPQFMAMLEEASSRTGGPQGELEPSPEEIDAIAQSVMGSSAAGLEGVDPQFMAMLEEASARTGGPEGEAQPSPEEIDAIAQAVMQGEI
jgi:hypothetical protein